MHCPSVSKSNCPENFYPAKIVVDRYSAKPRLNEIETFSNCLYKYHPEILWSLGYFAKTRHQTKNICFKESWSCWRSHNGRFWFCQSWWRWAKSARADVGQTALDTKKWSHIYNTSKRESRQEFFQTLQFKPHAIHPHSPLLASGLNPSNETLAKTVHMGAVVTPYSWLAFFGNWVFCCWYFSNNWGVSSEIFTPGVVTFFPKFQIHQFQLNLTKLDQISHEKVEATFIIPQERVNTRIFPNVQIQATCHSPPLTTGIRLEPFEWNPCKDLYTWVSELPTRNWVFGNWVFCWYFSNNWGVSSEIFTPGGAFF